MKRLRKLLCMAVAMLWVLPVSAMSWEQGGQGRLDLSGFTPVLESFEPLSNLVVADVDEFSVFNAADYQLHFEFLNAVWDDQSVKNLVIRAYDETGQLLDTSNTFEYQVDDTFTPLVLTIDPGDISAANNFVNGLPSGGTSTSRRIEIRPTLILDQVQDCNQQVIMRTWYRHDSAEVATSRPDHTVIPSVFAC